MIGYENALVRTTRTFKMAAKAGKKGKKKGTTMALTDFLSDETGSSPAPGTSYVLANKQMDWASEMEEADFGDSMESSYSMSAIDRAKLPTAPKAARGPEDLENVPTSPPFTAFIGNLPYEATEEKIREFFRNLPIDNVRLPEDNGRLRGFGYVQFDTRDALIEALLMKDESFGGRKVRIDLAGESQGGDNRQGGRGGRRDDGQPDRTEGDWRRSEVRQEPSFNDRERGGGSRYDDRGPSRYDDRRDDRGGGGFSDRRDDRGGGFDDRRGGGGFEDRRGGGGYDDRRGGGGGFDDRRGGGGFEDRRGGGGYDDRRGGGGYGRRDDRGGGGGGFGRDRFDDRDGGRRQFGSSFQRDDRGEEKAWERGPAPAAGGRDRGYGGDRNDRYGGGSAAGPERPVAEAPKERPRLNLQPRTKPVEKSAEDKPSKSASIFGSAKPVDTAQREREIEEKLLKQKDPAPAKSSLESRGYGGSRGYDEPSRDSGPRDSGSRDIRYDQGNKENRSVPSSRRRSGSDDDSRRERRSSGSSRSKKGSVSSQTRSRQDSGEQSQHGDAVFSGGEEDKSHNAVSPALREEPVKLVPAPPPKENIWEKRKTTQTQSPPQKPTEPKAPLEESNISSNQPKSPVNSQSADQSKRQSRNNSQSSQDLTPTKNEVKKDYVPAEPPKQNPWMKRQQERDLTSGKKDGPAPVPAGSQPAVSSAWGGRGGGAGDRGRGRGGRGGGRGRGEPRQRPERREKQLPQSVDEMPKMEDKKNRDFSDSNKFAGLMDDEGDSS